MTKKDDVIYHWKIIGAVLITVVLVFLAWKLSDIIILVITAVILAMTLYPAVVWMEKWFSRKTAAALITISMVLPMIIALAVIIPTFLSQINNIAGSLTEIINSVPFFPKLLHNFDITQYTSQAGQYLLASTSALTSFVAQIIILVFMIYYLLVDSANLYQLLQLLFPEKRRKRINQAIGKLSNISGQYIRGNLFISLICFLVVFIGLSFLKVPGAAALALFAGIFDLLPLVGAAIGAIPAIILAFTVSPLTGLLTIVLFWVYQEIENDYIIPRVYHKALKIIPFLSFISVIIGTVLFGIAGAFLALPIAASIPTLIHLFQNYQKTEANISE